MDLRPAAAATLFLALCSQSGMAEQRTATLGVSARVVRSCAVHSGPTAGTIHLTCSRGATPGIVTGSSASVQPVAPMRTTSIEPFEPAANAARQTAGTMADVRTAPVFSADPTSSPGAGSSGIVLARATMRSALPGATPIATPAMPVGRPGGESGPARANQRQVVTINF